MPRLNDLTGRRFGKLTAIERCGTDSNGSAVWMCLCDCGNSKRVSSRELMRGDTKSCGCARHNPRKHGMSNSRLYRIWSGMKNRCLNPNANAYERYGGKGITICEEWASNFEAFRDWAFSNGYSDDLTIERKSNQQGYFPSNCIWTTQLEQAQNRESCIYVTIDGETKNLQQWCTSLGMSYKLAHNRIRKLGWEPIRALTTPVDETKRNKKRREN